MKHLSPALMILLTGCASPFALMVNPKTGATVECSASGRGIISAAMASNRFESCVQQYEGLGFDAAAPHRAAVTLTH